MPNESTLQTDAPASAPLNGYRVLDISTMIAGPYCASILGEFGAEVIKVEMPGTGDTLRKFGTSTEAGSSLVWLNEARNKKSVTLDLRNPDGMALLKKLAAKADVVVENFRPGTLEKWGLTYDDLKRENPRLVFARISAYGQDGPYAGRTGFARIAHAFAGLSYLAGEPGRVPVVPGSTSLADYVTGLYAAIGVLIAVIGRAESGRGQVVDIGLYEGILRMLDEMPAVFAKHGTVRERMGADTVNVVPHSHYPTKDGKWVAIACTTDRMWDRLAGAMVGYVDVPSSYASMEARLACRDDVNRLVGMFTSALDRDHLLDLLIRHDVPSGPINSIEDIHSDPHVKARNNLVGLEHPLAGTVVVQNVLPRLSGTPGSIKWLGPHLGEHNQEVYEGLLGLSGEQVAAYKQMGII